MLALCDIIGVVGAKYLIEQINTLIYENLVKIKAIVVQNKEILQSLRITFDRPEMINRLNSLDHALEEIPYRQTYTSFSDLVQEEKLGILYDSVVFQHIIDKNYLLDIFNLLNSMESFRTFVSIYNASVRPVHIEMLLEKNWRVWHTETETLSFDLCHCSLLH